MQSTEFGGTMNSENGARKDATRKVYREYRAIVIARVKGKAGARTCEVCCWYKTHEEQRRKGNFCICDRFSADGFRTRATRVIRWRVLGVRTTKGETERRGTGRPGESWARKSGVCVRRCALCVRRAGTRGPFHAPPQLKPRYEVKIGKKRQ